MERHEVPFARKVVIATAIPLATILIVLLIATATPIFLLFFVGALFALVLRAGGDLIARYTRLPDGVSLALFVVLVIGLFVAFALGMAPRVADQLSQLSEQLPEALDRLEQAVRQLPWAAQILERIPDVVETVQEQPQLLAPLRSVFSVTVGIITGLLVFLVVGLYLAATPDLYVQAFLQLAPPAKRQRMNEVFHRLAHVLRMWLLGRAIGMVFVGVLTALGLLWLDVPLWLALGFIAGILDFVPNIGPLLAAIPAVLIALMDSPTTALYVILLYTAVQQLESYLIEPVIVQRVVRIAPAYNIIVQILMAVILGFAGLLLATPLMVMLMVLIQELYVKDVLEATRRVNPAPDQVIR